MWTWMERQPDNEIKTERNQGRSETKRLTSGEMKERERDRKKKRETSEKQIYRE